MNIPRPCLRWTVFVCCLIAMIGTGCSRESKATAIPDNSDAGSKKTDLVFDPNLISIDHADQFPRAKVEVREVADEWKVNGIVTPDVSRTVPVLSMSGGRTIEIRARVGDEVRKGQVLVRLQSGELSSALADLASAQADYRKSQTDRLLAERELERSKRLYEEKAIAQRDLQQAEDILTKAVVDVETADSRKSQNIADGTNLKSIDNSPNLFTIADLSRVWVLCDVYENNLGRIHVGDFAEVRLNAYPDRPIKARVGNISKVLDPSTRSAKVRLEIDNPNGLLRPNMFAVVKFLTQWLQKRMMLPASAIMRLHDKDWAFRYNGDKGFRRVMITAGPVTADQFQQILDGLQEADEVAANALQLSAAAEQRSNP